MDSSFVRNYCPSGFRDATGYLECTKYVLNEPQAICLNYVRQEYDKRTSIEDRAPINLMVELKDNCPSF